MIKSNMKIRVNTSIEKPIGQALRSIRESKGVSRKSLANSLGVSCQQLQKYECGKNRIPLSRLVLISSVLHMDISELCKSLCLSQTTYVVHKIPTIFQPIIEDYFRFAKEEEQQALCQLLKLLTHSSPTTKFNGGKYVN